MNFDVNTLFQITVYVEALLGLLLLFAWAQNAQIMAVAWWGFSHLMLAASVGLFGLYGEVSDLISIDLANAVLFLAYASLWTGARVFDHRAPLPGYMLAGPLIWFFASHAPVLTGDLDLRVLFSCGIITTYTWLAAHEFWRGRAEPLVSRWPAIFMLFTHGALFLLRTPLASLLPWLPTGTVVQSVWLIVLSFEALLFSIAIAFILLAMAKERAEYRHRMAALVDPLTGIANRRSFLEDGATLGKRHAARACPTAVMLIDLDHFKSINDRFGHAVGDRVLQIFAEIAKDNIKTPELIGRLGGEEFAAVLYDVGQERATVRAELIRTAFAEATADVEGHAVHATLSVGMVFNAKGRLDVPALLIQADRALYDAKARGRNRVSVVAAAAEESDAIETDTEMDVMAERLAAVSGKLARKSDVAVGAGAKTAA
jgi:diguanylate cyclase (GGDEF)-like protein